MLIGMPARTRRARYAALPLAAIGLCIALSGCGDAGQGDVDSAAAAGIGAGTAPLATTLARSDKAIAAGKSAVTVSPLPGTPDASPSSQISFLGGPKTTVLNVRVVGSRSGVHNGKLAAYSTGTGESFLPRKPFVSGESVTVSAKVRSGGRVEAVSTSFKVIAEAKEPTARFPNHASNPAEVLHFKSAPNLTPSAVKVITPPQKGFTNGDFFLAPYRGTGAPGPMIVQPSGQLVWFHRLPAGQAATNFQVQRYEGKPVLTWWQGNILKLGFGRGEDLLYNSSYQRIGRVRAGNGYHADLHEIRLTPQGTAWIDAFVPIHMNLSRYGGASDSAANDSVIQEIDVKTGLVMWEWHAFGHIPLTNSKSKASQTSRPWDYVHINSADPGGNGDVLLSSRNTWTLYDVNIHTGAINWTLGNGVESSFKLGNGVRFYWQHDTRWQPHGLISLFDNGSSPPMQSESSGLLLRPEYKQRRVSLVKRFSNPPRKLLASSQGDVVRLQGGNWLLGYGELPAFTQYNSAGEVLYEATLGENDQSFRSFQTPWHGTPKQRPSIVAERGAGGALTVYASWNGATDAFAWRLLAGPSTGSLKPVATAQRSGFETTIDAPLSASSARYVAVQALSSAGKLLRASKTIEVR